MALIYEKIVGDKVVILEPREACIRVPLASSNQWTELRIGVAVSATSVAASNAAYPSESFVASTVYDRFSFGLKNGDTDDLPGVAGSTFWGANTVNGETMTLDATTGNFTESSNRTYSVWNGATLIDSDVPGHGRLDLPSAVEAQAATLFAMFWMLRIVITDRGLATQTVQFARSMDAGNNKTDCSEIAMRAFLVAMPNISTLSGAITANSGGVALPVPDAFFLRFPTISSRLRVHNVMVMQAVP